MHRAARLLAPLALLLATAFACQSVPPAHEAESRATARADAPVVVERLLAVSVAGQPFGVLETRLEIAPDGSRTTREVMTISLVRTGGGPDAELSSTKELLSIHDPEHRLVSETSIEREAGVTITRTITLEGDELVSSYAGPGRPSESKRFELPEDYRSALAVNFELVEEWRRTGKPATRRFSSFDPRRERFEWAEVTLTGETEVAHDGETIPAYTFRTQWEDGSVVESIDDHQFTPLRFDLAGTYVASLVEERPKLGRAGLGRIDTELPVSGRTSPRWQQLASQRVTVTVEGDDPQAPPLWTDGHYHRVEREGQRYELELLSTRPPEGFVAPQLPMKIDDPKLRRYLAPTTTAQSDDPQIVAAAKQIVAGETDALLAARKIVTAVFERLDKQAGVRGSATASEVLQNGAGDCTEHAVLVVALMRAAGIPARAVDGIVLASDADGRGQAGYHAWAEIWLGRWIGVDATVNETGTSARYLELGLDEPGELGAGGKMVRAFGKTKIELGPHRLDER